MQYLNICLPIIIYTIKLILSLLQQTHTKKQLKTNNEREMVVFELQYMLFLSKNQFSENLICLNFKCLLLFMFLLKIPVCLMSLLLLLPQTLLLPQQSPISLLSATQTLELSTMPLLLLLLQLTSMALLFCLLFSLLFVFVVVLLMAFFPSLLLF